MLRLPYFGNGFAKSMLIVVLAIVVLSGIALLFSWSLPVPDAQQDVMFKPPISGG
jgi:hypothetical protein